MSVAGTVDVALPSNQEGGVVSVPKKKSSKKTHRVQLELPSQSMERLEALKELTGASSYAEVIRNSIRLHEDMAKEAAKGGEFLLQYKDGPISPYKAFILA